MEAGLQIGPVCDEYKSATNYDIGVLNLLKCFKGTNHVTSLQLWTLVSTLISFHHAEVIV